jgi:gliding motility-associated lipoprotein GldH
MKTALYLLGGFILLTLTWSCNRGVVYEFKHTFEDSIWKYEHVAHFEFDIADTSISYNFYLDVEHLTTFSFQNLYVKMHSSKPDLEVITDIHSLELQEKTGEWLGDCSRNKCELRFVLREGLKFNQVGKYIINIEQFSRNEKLDGIASLGIYLEKAQ